MSLKKCNKKNDHKMVTIKEYGFWYWYFYQLENNQLFLIIHTSILSAVTCAITNLIIRSCN